ncbi:MAG TPA: excinuclease ABC subunit UvrC [Candidatus Copromorpha excrementigallinarum]|uniref:UvrABC system protein C n=1 Tax=Candidatus Allocopromorpha excrementigallinarum TaxID=2840742 RepID=A0A9D1I0X9_9FIRM|nr:excinuclease ABC subunit UvrC [Candidatus Copromorpha excrementigallinarum]
MFDIKENLKQLPDSPGVYMHKDRLGNIIYVGKAVSLKNRVRQYFQSTRNMPPKVRSMVGNIAEFEYITTGSEMEALILECNLIKKYRPRYNVLLRDDKTYPYIKITNEEYPRVIKTRLVKNDGGRYFGPYSDAGAVNKIVDLLNSSFSLKRCSASVFPKGFRPCLNYHINQCRGICSGTVNREEYMEAVEGARDFLNGKNRRITEELKRKMKKASEALDFEEAALYRDYIEAVKALSETQRVVMHHSKDVDIVIPAKGREETYMVIFSVREGKLAGRESFGLDAFEGEESGELISAFINQHYNRLANFPKEILLTQLPEDRQVIEEYLTSLAGHNVKLLCPQKGEKRALVELAVKDVKEMVKTIDERAEAARERKHALGAELFAVLKKAGEASGEYDGSQFRVEAYDISNTNGVDTVGAMVVFDGLAPDRKGYRKFRVRTVEGQDDYGSMREVLSRRLARVFKGDPGFEVLPDVILMDGGKGHVACATEVIKASGLHIPVLGMAKDDSHRTRALVYRDGKTGEYGEVELSVRPLLFKYMGQVQEEVHRFAIEYHRKVRGRNAQRSVLDEIKGVGPARRKALLEEFKSVDAIRAASLEALEKAPGMNRPAAKSVWEYFHREENT